MSTTQHRPSFSLPERSLRRTAIRSGWLVILLSLFAISCSGDELNSVDAASDTADSVGLASGDDGGDVDEAMETDEAFTLEAMSEVSDGGGDVVPSSGDRTRGDSAATVGASAAQPDAEFIDFGRDIVYTATLELGATDVTRASTDVIAIIERRGGFLFSQNTSGGSGGSSLMVFKVAPDQFQTTLSELGQIGTVRSQEVTADDVTSIVVDLESRITTAEASVIRLRDMLEASEGLNAVARLENQLLERETSLEQLRGRLRMVRNQVDLATLTVVITEILNRPSLTVATSVYAGHDSGFGCFNSPRAGVGQQGDPRTLCYRIVNTGDTDLIDLAIDEEVGTSGVTIDQLVVVEGTRETLAPGESVVLANEFELEDSFMVRTTVTATGIDTDGQELDAEARATTGTLRFDVENDGLPSFGKVLSDSWSALVTVIAAVALVAVAVAPFLAVLILLFLVARGLLRRFGRSGPTLSQRFGQQGPERTDRSGPDDRADASEPTPETTVSGTGTD